jgi:predicted ArsR family transcriptional regulator
MNPQTRQLIALLADDAAARMLDALRREASTAAVLVRETGASPSTVAQTLDLLSAHGVIRWHQGRAGARGRPSRVWELAATAQLEQFEQACNRFKAALLRAQLAELDPTAITDKNPRVPPRPASE